MQKFSIVLEDLIWTLPSITDTELAKSLPSSFATIVEHDDEHTAKAIALLQCECKYGLELLNGDYRMSVCLLEADVVD